MMEPKSPFLAELEGMSTIGVWTFVLIASWTCLYAHQTIAFHRAHQSKNLGQIPPSYPSLVPYLTIAVSLLWNPRKALARFTLYNGQYTVSRLSFLPWKHVFIYQDPAIIRQIWKQSSHTDFRPMSTYFHTTVCGMSKEAALLRLGQSPAQSKSSLGRNRPNTSHVHQIISHGNRQGLTGRGLTTTIRRFINAFHRKTHELVPESFSDGLNSSWLELDDLWKFVQDTTAASELEAIFGPSLIRLHPTFVRTFFKYSEMGPMILKGLPSKKAVKLRNDILYQLKTWRHYAKEHFTDTDIFEDGDGDPFWGSAWTRYRHHEFPLFFDDNAMASHDLSVAWGAMDNTVPCALMALVHVLQDKALLSRVRSQIDAAHDGRCNNYGKSLLEPEKLSKIDLLSSIYAETLRLHVSISVPVIPMHGDLTLGKWRIPKGSYGLISAGIAHTNRDAWNTREDRYRLQSFWADRFILDPCDPLSGPCKSRTNQPWFNMRHSEDDSNREKQQPYFTTQGLEGSWIPYGGGQNMCPGRFLSKTVILSTLAFLITDFDIELRVGKDSIVMDESRFGLGADLPSSPIPFRIRRKISGRGLS